MRYTFQFLSHINLKKKIIKLNLNCLIISQADKRTLKKKKIAVNCDEEGGDTDLVTCTSNGESSSNDPTFAESSESKQGVPAAEG